MGQSREEEEKNRADLTTTLRLPPRLRLLASSRSFLCPDAAGQKWRPVYGGDTSWCGSDWRRTGMPLLAWETWTVSKKQGKKFENFEKKKKILKKKEKKFWKKEKKIWKIWKKDFFFCRAMLCGWNWQRKTTSDSKMYPIEVEKKATHRQFAEVGHRNGLHFNRGYCAFSVVPVPVELLSKGCHHESFRSGHLTGGHELRRLRGMFDAFFPAATKTRATLGQRLIRCIDWLIDWMVSYWILERLLLWSIDWLIDFRIFRFLDHWLIDWVSDPRANDRVEIKEYHKLRWQAIHTNIVWKNFTSSECPPSNRSCQTSILRSAPSLRPSFSAQRFYAHAFSAPVFVLHGRWE